MKNKLLNYRTVLSFLVALTTSTPSNRAIATPSNSVQQFGGCQVNVTPTPKPATSKLTGRVIASDTQQPLPNISILATNLENRTNPENTYGQIDSDGYFTIQVQSGQYVLRTKISTFISPTIYAEEYYSNTSSFENAYVIDVVSGTTISGINFELDKGSQLVGRVTTADTGDPIKGLNVYISDIFDYFLIGFGGTTDFNGYFTSTIGLKPGTYRFQLQNSGNCSGQS